MVVAEVFSLAQQFDWGLAKKDRLADLLRELVVVEIHAGAIVETWARFHAFLKKRGFMVSHNDIWIAATTAAVGGILLTTDKDFTPLCDERWLDAILIAPAAAAAPSDPSQPE